ncbi:glycosyltransferase [Neobacillus drentensis]|uniref:glycosyltransferase n=1 Tax=Neobacillus drentensis TaxID=220684 RepID=UPI002FFF0B62
MSYKYAPVVLFVYNRPNHTAKTIEHLKNNNLADKTDLFIFSDAAKSDKQTDKVKLVREYIGTISGFKSVTICEAEKNRGLAKSIISGVSDVLNKYGVVIVLEDDIITAPCFLEYMNSALTFYKDDKEIWSITGYNYPFEIPNSYKETVYLSYRASSWSWATWKDRWDTVDWDIKDYAAYRWNPIKIAQFCKGGTDLDKMLRNQMKGLIDSWAIRWCYNQSFQKKYTIYPCSAIATNIGTDGTGTHFSENSSRYNSRLDENYKYEFKHHLQIDPEIMRRYRKIVNRSIIRRIKRILRVK